MITKRPWWVIAFVIVLGGISIFSARSLELSSVTDGLVTPGTHDADSSQRPFKENATIIVLVNAPNNILEPDFLSDLRAASHAIEAIEAVVRTTDITKIRVPDTRKLVPPMVPLTDKYPKEDQSLMIRELRFLTGTTMASKDLHTAIIYVQLYSTMLSDRESIDLVSEIGTRLDPFGFDYQLVGQAVVREALVIAAVTDTISALAVTAIITILVLFTLYRSLWLTLLPLMTSVCAILFTGGVMAALEMPLNNLTVLVAPLLLVINVASSIHVITEFQRLCSGGADRAAAAMNALGTKFKPFLLAALTTCAGFLALTLSNTPVLVDFAIAAASGVTFGFLLTVILLPACLSLSPPGHRCVAHTSGMMHLMGRISNSNVPIVLIITLSLGATSIYGLTRLGSDTVIMDVFSDDHPVVTAQNRARDITGGLTFIDLTITAPAQSFSRIEALKWLQALTTLLRKHPSVVEVLSLSTLLSKSNAYYERDPFGPERMPDTQSRLDQLVKLIRENPETTALDNLVTADFSSTRLIVQAQAEGSNALIQLYADIQDTVVSGIKSPLSYSLDNSELAYAKAVNHVVDDQVRSFSLVIAGIVLVILIAFRSLPLTAIALVTNLVPIAAVFGIMGWLEIKLDFFNVMVACIALGIVVDDSMHLISHYVRTGKREIRIPMQQVGTAIISTSLVLILGFSGIAASASLAGTYRFALLAALAVLFALIATLWLLPALLSLTYSRKNKIAVPDQ